MKLSCRFLSDDERRRIHDDSLKILWEIGVEFRSDNALKILADAGAIVDEDARIARIPEELVDQALKTAPGSFVLGARNSEFDFPLPSPHTAYTLDGSATFAIDFETGSRRTALTKDLIDALRIFEEMPLAAVGWPAVHCDDAPQHSVAIHANLTSFIHSSKHFQNEVFGVREVPYLIDAMATILGGEDAIEERKIFSLIYCTIPPLGHAGDMCDAYLELAKYHVPILPYPMPSAGSTGPASLYSDTAVANAESLSALVLFQMAEPGTPIIYGHAAGITNFSFGTFLEGAPESTLINGALGEMARFYGLPNTQSGCLTDAKQPGGQAITEKALSTLSLVLSGVDAVQGTGLLDTSQLLVLEQIVVDHEIACMCKRYRDGIDVSDAKDYFTDVASTGPGGHFITRPSTLKACRSEEFFMPTLCDRNSYETWEAMGRPDVYDEARQKVEEILSSPPKNPLPEDVAGKLEAIMRKAARELAAES
jgi:trimethylamine--corrinoid protein Co-methyltransferase